MSLVGDEISLLNISLVDEDVSILNESVYFKSSKDTIKKGLKQQEQTIDSLKKENFDLRLSLYFYEQKLNDMSPENIDHALKENINLKVTIQKLTEELKKYKEMILELNEAISIINNRTCSHGMTEEEKKKMENLSFENQQLEKSLSEVLIENMKYESLNKEHQDLYQKYKYAKKTIEENNIKNKDYDSIISNLNDLNQELEKDLIHEKDKVKLLELELEKCIDSLNEKKKQLYLKTMEYDDLIEQVEDLRVNNENMGSFIDHIRQLEDENDELINQAEEREEEIELLESKVTELLNQIENKRWLGKDLEFELIEKEKEIEKLNEELESSRDIELNLYLQQELKEKENQEILNRLEGLEREFNKLLDCQYNELSTVIREKEVKFEALEGHFDATTDTMEREKKILKEEINELKSNLCMLYKELKKREEYMIYSQSDIKELREKLQKQTIEFENQTKDYKLLELKLIEKSNRLNTISNLKAELIEKDKVLKEYKELFENQLQETEYLKNQLEKKEQMLNNSLLAHKATKEKVNQDNLSYSQSTGIYILDV